MPSRSHSSGRSVVATWTTSVIGISNFRFSTHEWVTIILTNKVESKTINQAFPCFESPIMQKAMFRSVRQQAFEFPVSEVHEKVVAFWQHRCSVKTENA
jgi:hypothetical protein